jgi:hypothetical protein
MLDGVYDMSRCFQWSWIMGLALWSWQVSAAWSSGGGGLFRDANNAWFVHNTDSVRYCIRIDESQSSLSEEQVNRAFRRAVAYWQHEFAFTNFATADVIISTQVFEKTSCDPSSAEDADLVLQIGYLTELQKQEIKSYETYASLAVRTHYDEKNLRARGFIYLASEKSLRTIQGYELTEDLWSGHDQILHYWTLVHELGHVFGIQHTGQTPSARNVMSYGFVEYILQKRHLGQVRSNPGSKAFFQIHAEPQDAPELICYQTITPTLQTLQKYFSLPRNWLCFGTWLRDLSLEIWAAPSVQQAMQPVRIGTIHFLQERKEARPAMTFWIPEAQTVLRKKDYPVLPSYVVRNIKGRYVHAQKGSERRLGLVLDPRQDSPLLNDLRIMAEFDGVSYMDLIKGF